MFIILDIGEKALERISSDIVILGSIVSKDINTSSKDVNFMFLQTKLEHTL